MTSLKVSSAKVIDNLAQRQNYIIGKRDCCRQLKSVIKRLKHVNSYIGPRIEPSGYISPQREPEWSYQPEARSLSNL